MSAPSGGLNVRFWGARGSIPTPGPQTEKFGGNTTCLEIRCGNTLVVIDAGSGIRDLGLSWLREFGDRPVHANLLFTHLHWDHIQGFPFFAPAYRKGNTFEVYGEERNDGGVRELLGGQMRGSYFPVPLAAMQSDLVFKTTSSQFNIGPIAVKTKHLPHPQGCLGYRLEAAGSTFVLATDSELDMVALNGEEIKADPRAPRKYDSDLLEFFANAHMIVIDCQYTDEQYRTKRGWGHNGMSTVVDLCRQVRPEMLVLFHHDPQNDDNMVSAMVDDACGQLCGHSPGPLVLGARERMTMQVGKPLRPLKIPLT